MADGESVNSRNSFEIADEKEATTDTDRSETCGSEVLGHSASMPKLNKGTSSLLVAESSKDPGRPLPSKKVTLVRKKSLSENCLLPKPRIQRRDGQVTNKPFTCLLHWNTQRTEKRGKHTFLPSSGFFVFSM